MTADLLSPFQVGNDEPRQVSRNASDHCQSNAGAPTAKHILIKCPVPLCFAIERRGRNSAMDLVQSVRGVASDSAKLAENMLRVHLNGAPVYHKRISDLAVALAEFAIRVRAELTQRVATCGTLLAPA